MPPADPLPHLLSIDELAEHLGVTVRHVRRLIAERRIPFLRVGRLIRFDPAEVTAWLDGRRVTGSRPAQGRCHHPSLPCRQRRRYLADGSE
jgi:excisionase family DNA binding protein